MTHPGSSSRASPEPIQLSLASSTPGTQDPRGPTLVAGAALRGLWVSILCTKPPQNVVAYRGKLAMSLGVLGPSRAVLTGRRSWNRIRWKSHPPPRRKPATLPSALRQVAMETPGSGSQEPG